MKKRLYQASKSQTPFSTFPQCHYGVPKLHADVVCLFCLAVYLMRSNEMEKGMWLISINSLETKQCWRILICQVVSLNLQYTYSKNRHLWVVQWALNATLTLLNWCKSQITFHLLLIIYITNIFYVTAACCAWWKRDWVGSVILTSQKQGESAL